MWQQVYKHDKNGNTIEGTKNALIDAIKNGSSLKVIVNVGKYELCEMPNRIWISQGEVYASSLQYFYNHKVVDGVPSWDISTIPWIAIWGTDGKELVTKPGSTKVNYKTRLK